MANYANFNKKKFIEDNPTWKDQDFTSTELLDKIYKQVPNYFADNNTTTSAATQSPLEGTTVGSSTANKRSGTPAQGGTANKVQAIPGGSKERAQGTNDSAQTSQLAAEMNLPGTGKAQGEGGGDSYGQTAYYVDRPFSKFGLKENVYHKSHKFMTFGLAPNVITGTADLERFLMTYLAEVPWHVPAFYMNQSEFDLLPFGTKVKAVHVKCIYRGSTIQFETNQSSTQIATLNQINDIAYAHALNKTGWGSDFSFISFDATNPMLPTGIQGPKYRASTGTSPYRGMVADYYGTNNDGSGTATNFVNYIPHHQIGRHTFLYNYFGITTKSAITTPTNNINNMYGGWYPFANKITQADGKTMVNTVVTESSYEPKMGWLKQPLRTITHGVPFPQASTGANGAITIPVGGHLPSARKATLQRTLDANEGFQLSQSETTIDHSNVFGTTATTIPIPDIYTPIEKSQVSRSGWWGEQDPHIQPSLHIGVQPVPAVSTAALLANNTGFNQWTNCRAYWEVQATMIVTEHTPTELPFATQPNVALGENVVALPRSEWPLFNIDPSGQGATIAGLYPTISVPI